MCKQKMHSKTLIKCPPPAHLFQAQYELCYTSKHFPLTAFCRRLSKTSIYCSISFQRSAESQCRGVLYWHSSLCHIVFTQPRSSGEWPNCFCAILLLKEFETFLISRDISFQQREELVSQNSLDAFQSTIGKPTITFLEDSLTCFLNEPAHAYITTFADILLFVYHSFEHGISDVA